MNEQFLRCQGVLKSLLKTFKGYGLESEDWEQEAQLALLKAIDTFDATKGAALTSWAYWHIRHHLLNVLGKNRFRFNKEELSLDAEYSDVEGGLFAQKWASVRERIPCPRPTPEDALLKNELADRAEEALKTLAPEDARFLLAFLNTPRRELSVQLDTAPHKLEYRAKKLLGLVQDKAAA